MLEIIYNMRNIKNKLWSEIYEELNNNVYFSVINEVNIYLFDYTNSIMRNNILTSITNDIKYAKYKK